MRFVHSRPIPPASRRTSCAGQSPPCWCVRLIANVVAPALAFLLLSLSNPAAPVPPPPHTARTESLHNPTNSPAALEARLLADLARLGTNSDRLYRLADVCHDAGVAGDKKAVERAESYLRELLAHEPTNAPALALLGSVYTMKGRDAFWPNVQLRLVHEGNAFMDQAVQLAPDNVRVRLTRAFNNAHMPDFLGRVEIVRADLAWLWDRAEQSPDLVSAAEHQELALHWGRQLKRLKRLDEARRVWTRGRNLRDSSSLAADIDAELAKLH